MQTENNIFLQNQKNALTMMIRPTGVSIIAPLILDVVEKLGKYQFIYDYEFGGMQIYCIKAPCEGGIPSTKYSKGNVVNVIRFQGNIAVIENPNYVEPDPNAPKIASFWASLYSNKNEKEFNIPKEYLSKVDDSTPVTVNAGVNFGSNPKPQPVYNMPPVKFPNFQNIPNPNSDLPFIPKLIPELDNEVVLEQSADFVLNQDYKYRENSYCPPNARCMQPPEVTINAGTKVTGRLIRRNNNTAYIAKAGFIAPNSYNDFLEVKGEGKSTSLINIPVGYLTREAQNNTTKYYGSVVQNNTSDNSGTVVPVQNNNNNLLMIAGAFLAGYIIFGNSKSSN
jgi:hypothetical protein